MLHVEVVCELSYLLITWIVSSCSCGHTAKWMLTKGDISARAWRGYWSSIWGPHWFCSSGAWGAWGPNHSISNWKLFILVRRRLNCWRNNGFLCIFACTAVMTKLQLFSWAKWHRVYDLVHILLYAWIMMTLLFDAILCHCCSSSNCS